MRDYYKCLECGKMAYGINEITQHMVERGHKNIINLTELKHSEQPWNKYDLGKARVDLVPPAIIEAVAEVREYGNNKYKDPNSWRTVEPYRYIAALGRHFCDYLRDPKSVDSESGIAHLKHMACNIAFLLEMEREED